ncbi:MAG: GNAT family N-acetyltransferase [Leptolyngbyaceae cyanobacterium]
MIRPTVPSDHSALLELAQVSNLFEPEEIKQLTAMLKFPGKQDVWFTDDHDVGPVGVAYLAPEKMTTGTWNLYWLAVHPHHQKQGRGRALLTYVQQWLMDRGARLLLVETAGIEAVEYVWRFYASCGFEREARIRDFYDVGVDKVIFRKAIALSNTQAIS